MNQHLKGAAKCLIFSLSVAATLSGCAIYDPGYPAGYAYAPYGYAQPAYPTAPYYVGPPSGPYYAGPPVALDLWFFSGRGGGGHYGHHGGWGGHRGGWGGHHGGWGGHHGGWGGRGR